MILGAGTGLKIAKGILDKNKNGNLLGKAKAFTSKLSEKLGSLDDSLDATNEELNLNEENQQQTKGLFGESKKEREEREAREAADAAAKKKSQMMMYIAAAFALFLFMRKK